MTSIHFSFLDWMGGLGTSNAKASEREREKWGRVMSSQAVIDVLVHY